MARCAAAPVCVSTKHRRRLEAIVRQHHAPQSLVLRARIILMASDGVGVRETAGKFGVGRDLTALAQTLAHQRGGALPRAVV